MTEGAETKTFRLSRRLSCNLTVGPGGIVVEWSPGLPEKLTPKEMRRYVAARHEMVTRLAERLGVAVAVVEI